MRAPSIDFEATTVGLIDQAVRRFGAQRMVVTPEQSFTYAQVDAASRVLARRLLAAGVGKGTRVGAQFAFGAEWLVAWLATTRIGALYLPFSTAYKPLELRKVLRQGDVDTLLAPPRMFGRDRGDYLETAVDGLQLLSRGRRLEHLPFLRRAWLCATAPGDGESVLDLSDTRTGEVDGISDALLREAEREVTPADLMAVIFTSGTSGDPKGVVHSHGALVRHGRPMMEMLELKSGDRIYCGSPLFWVGGLAFTLIPALHAGATMLGMERFDAATALDLMERERATVIVGWSGVTGPLMAHPGAATRDIPALHHPFWAPGGPRRHHALGMTETCGPHTGCNAETRQLPIPDGLTGSMGPALPFIEHRIVEPGSERPLPDGEKGAILVRGYSLMQGMVKREREELFSADGWYDTGDEGFFRDGLLFLTGRLTDMVKTSGNNVAPLEVEQALLSFPGVRQAYVAGIPDAQRGEAVAAALVMADGVAPDLQQLHTLLHGTLSNYKLPRKLVLFGEQQLPLLSSGKVDRKALKQLLADSRTALPWPPAVR